ncbi:MAG: U32 family peptidase [bacterium]|nr:U32 family peptidase [bacterium]
MSILAPGTVELLAPARDAATGMAAIRCGADAVYLGAPRFGARETAGNSLSDIATLSDFAHHYWARVYVALNTILRDDELPQAVQLAHDVAAAGADALIIQDVGLLASALPAVPLIASTQMHNDTPAKIAFLQASGFARVILARELSLDELGRLRAAAPAIELECFVHGAVCVCYSGQCALSYAIGGRSGNRGACAQPCRRAYTLVDATGRIHGSRKHWLSLKDMCRVDDLGALLDAGLTSFKIEGRMKDAAYVMNTVAYYRDALDVQLATRGLRRSSSGITIRDFTPDPAKTFNRGFSHYFLQGGNEDVTALDTPKSRGARLGQVTRVTARGFFLDSATSLTPGDGICFMAEHGELTGTTINAVYGAEIVPQNLHEITVGMLIHRNFDQAFDKQLRATRTRREIGVRMRLCDTACGIAVQVTDVDNVCAAADIACEKNIARNAEAMRATLQRQLAKCGDTGFRCDEVVCATAAMWFVPVAQLNELRRAALAALAVARAQQRPRPQITREPSPCGAAAPQSALDFHGNVLNATAAAFYRARGVAQIEPAAESGLDLHERVVMTCKYCVRGAAGVCLRRDNVAALREPLYLVDEDGLRLRIMADCAKCQMALLLEAAM